MPKLSRPHNPVSTRTTKLQRVRQDISEKFWPTLVILILVSMVVYGVVIQILHHP